jgi:hypothetical protein
MAPPTTSSKHVAAVRALTRFSVGLLLMPCGFSYDSVFTCSQGAPHMHAAESAEDRDAMTNTETLLTPNFS